MSAAPRVNTDEEVARLTRQRFHALVAAVGKPYGPQVYDPAPRLREVGPSDCWTHAWDAARSSGRIYVEGLCTLAGIRYAHAWTIDARGIAYEHTEGYAAAGDYVGVAIDTSPGSQALRIGAMFDDLISIGVPRGSLLEGLLANLGPDLDERMILHHLSIDPQHRIA